MVDPQMALPVQGTEWQQRESKLRMFASVVRDSNDAITVSGLDGTFEAWNRGAERMYGYSEAEALGMNIIQIVPASERQRATAILHQIQTGEPIDSVEAQRVTKDGRILDVWLTVTKLVDDRQKVVGFATTERDITRRKLVDAELLSIQEKEIGRLKELDEFKTVFINTAAHELRTPLTPLKLHLHALRSGKRGELNAEQKHTVSILTRNFDRLSQLVEDVLDVGRLQAGHLSIRPEPIEVNQLVADVVDSFQEMSRKGGVAIDSRLVAGLRLEADPKRLTQILFNLISNALKFTPEGGAVRVKAIRVGRNVEFHIIDTGVGLRPQDIARLFHPFTQIHDPMQRTNGGSGLGLYVCKGLVQLHGGHILCTSPGVGLGSTFTVSFPQKSELAAVEDSD